MRVLVLGGTGSIGEAVLAELIASGHDVLALARSESSAALMEARGAEILRGDMNGPATWVASMPPVDAVIHAASDFSNRMAATDAHLLDVLLPALGAMQRRPRFIYTGGCWLFGATGDIIATEATPLDPLPAFAWSVPTIARLLQAPEIAPLIVHPAMVYTHEGGVIFSFLEDAGAGRPIRIIGSENARWPLVHASDLAVLYRLMLENGAPGAVYNGAAIDGLAVRSIARAVAHRFGLRRPLLQIVSADFIATEKGEWARGYGLDQRMSSDKARRELGWQPVHTDPLSELAIPN